MISFDTSILVYATASVADAKALRARDLIARAMRTGWIILLLQTLAEFANVAIRKAGIPIEDIRRTIDAWRAGILRRRLRPPCWPWTGMNDAPYHGAKLRFRPLMIRRAEIVLVAATSLK